MTYSRLYIAIPYIRYFLCRSTNTEEVFTMNKRILLMELCLFIFDSYRVEIFNCFCILAQKQEIQYFVFSVIVFLVIYKLFIDL